MKNIVVGISLSCDELEHVDALKRRGVPMKNYNLFYGVESGTLSWEDKDGYRYYRWYTETRIETESKPWWKPKFTIVRRETLGETWYEVREKVFYWPFWETWTTGKNTPQTIKFNSLYLARKAIELRENPKLGAKASILEHL